MPRTGSARLGSWEDLDRALAGCEDDAAARDFYLGLMATIAPGEIQSLLGGNLQKWQGKIPPETLEGILLERLRREPESGAAQTPVRLAQQLVHLARFGKP